MKINITTKTSFGPLAVALLMVIAAPVWAEPTGQIFEVGPEANYRTINEALDAIPSWEFDRDMIIQIKAGTYEPFHTDLMSRLNNLPSRTAKDTRLIIQAAPGEEVIIHHENATPSSIRESHVTVQGIKFTGIESSPSAAYLVIGSPGYETPNNQRGGLIVQNCEFVGARGLNGLVNEKFDGEEEGVDFSYAFVRNAVLDFEHHYENPGNSSLPQFQGGNLYAGWGKIGGVSIFYPRSHPGDGKRWYLNNTLYSNTGNLSGVLRLGEGTLDHVIFVNNLTHWASPEEGKHFYKMYDAEPTDAKWPIISHNFLYQDTPLNWGRIGGFSHSTRGDWMAAGGADDTMEDNPQFVDPENGDFRLAAGSSAVNAADADIWKKAIEELGIADRLESYWNPARDKGFQRPEMKNQGAMQTAP